MDGDNEEFLNKTITKLNLVSVFMKLTWRPYYPLLLIIETDP